MRGTWADGRIQLVEHCIGNFIVGLNVAAAAIKKNRLEREEWVRCKKQEHKRRAEFITELIEKWEEAQRGRAFVKAMTECSSQLELSEEEKSDIQQVRGLDEGIRRVSRPFIRSSGFH